MTAQDDPLGEGDDLVAGFQIEGRPVRGRIVRLGPTLDLILKAHAYPAPVARLVGEAAMIAALVGDSLKFDGKLIVQANGDGPVRFVVAEWTPGEGLRAYAQIDAEAAAALPPDAGAKALLGAGSFAMTIDPGGDMDRYQGVVALEGDSLTHCAEDYFARSEQTPTRIKLAVAERLAPGTPHQWRGGGAILQQVAGDDARGDPQADWEHGLALFDTIQADELVDPEISAGELLYRLFHEDGVRLHPPRPAPRRCTCTRERLMELLASFPAADRGEMVKDGRVRMVCEYCNKAFDFTSGEIEPGS